MQQLETEKEIITLKKCYIYIYKEGLQRAGDKSTYKRRNKFINQKEVKTDQRGKPDKRENSCLRKKVQAIILPRNPVQNTTSPYNSRNEKGKEYLQEIGVISDVKKNAQQLIEINRKNVQSF